MSVLRQMLKRGDMRVRLYAVSALGKIGPGAKEAVPDLVEMLRGTYCRSEAFDALCQVGPAAREALPALVKFVDDSNYLLSAELLETTGKIELSGPVMVKLIVRWMDNRSGLVRSQSKMLWNVLGPQDIPSIKVLVRSRNKSDRSRACGQIMRVRTGRDAGAD